MRSTLDQTPSRRELLTVSASVTLAAALAWTYLGLRESPDFALYTRGGVHIYPSPLGTLIGSGGAQLLAACSAIAVGITTGLVGWLARKRWALYGFPLLPSCWHLYAAGVDSLAAAALVAGIALTGRYRAMSWIASVCVHPAALPFVVLSGLRARLDRRVGLVLLVAAAIVLVVTPYGGIGANVFHHPARTVAWFVVNGCIIVLPLLYLVRGQALYAFTPWLAIVAAAAEAGAQGHLQLRYGVPAAAVAFITWGRLVPSYVYTARGERFGAIAANTYPRKAASNA